MNKRYLALLPAAFLTVLCACQKPDTRINVQPVERVSRSAQAGDRYFGEVVSSQTIEITRDDGKAVKECFVKAGQPVKKNEKLFAYDLDAARIAAEKQKLEIEKMENEQKEFQNQLSTLEKRLQATDSDSEKNRLTLEISSLKNDLLESEYRLKAKQKEQETLEKSLETGEVLSPIDGVVQKVSDTEDGPYLVLQQTGNFRIKGLMNELNLGGEIREGAAVRVISRRNPDLVWNGVVKAVGKDPAAKDGNESPARSASYPFYVEPEHSDGLILGEHVYLEPVGDRDPAELWLPAGYVENVRDYPMENKTTGTVWVDNGSGKLEQAAVTTGSLDAELGSYPIYSGLSPDQWIADPAQDGCREGALTRGRIEKETAENLQMPEQTEETEETQ